MYNIIYTNYLLVVGREEVQIFQFDWQLVFEHREG